MLGRRHGNCVTDREVSENSISIEVLIEGIIDFGLGLVAEIIGMKWKMAVEGDLTFCIWYVVRMEVT